MALGLRWVRSTAQHAVAPQLLEWLGEQMARHPEPRLEILKASHAQEAVSQNEQTPPVADNGNGAGNRTLLLFQRVPLHIDLRIRPRSDLWGNRRASNLDEWATSSSFTPLEAIGISAGPMRLLAVIVP